jgi:chemotaxis protein methyltransferase CheR
MDNYDSFKSQVYLLTNINLNAYKERQMKRRIDAFISRRNLSTYHTFITELNKNPDLLKDFINYLTINVSEFFRNPEQWSQLEKDIIPYLLKNFGDKLKIWSAACSTGDEPYSMVMVLSKFLPLSKIRIFATDIDNEVLEKARIGLYNEKSLKGIPDEFIAKYFTKINSNTYQVSEQIRSCVTFNNHNLLDNNYLQRCDLIVCRNVLIYFTEEAKDEIYHKFNASLKAGGILFVGSTEQIIQPQRYNFSSCQSFFYKKT